MLSAMRRWRGWLGRPVVQSRHDQGRKVWLSYGRGTKKTPGDGNPSQALLQAILSSPLIVPPGKNSGSTAGEYGLRRFQQLVATGTATLQAARDCLQQRLREDRQQADVRMAMKRSHMGATMLNWLWSSGQMVPLKFVHDCRFLRPLCAYLVAEGRQQVVLDWIRTVGRGTDRKSDAIVAALCEAEMRYGGGPAAAIDLLASERCSKEAVELHMGILVKYAARNLHNAVIDESDYRRLENIVTEFGHAFRLHSLHLAIMHPHQSRPEAAIESLRTINIPMLSVRARKHYARLLIKAAQVFMDRDEHAQALRVMEALENELSATIGIATASDEAGSLSLLDQLHIKGRFA